jgi:hypothetical protein
MKHPTEQLHNVFAMCYPADGEIVQKPLPIHKEGDTENICATGMSLVFRKDVTIAMMTQDCLEEGPWPPGDHIASIEHGCMCARLCGDKGVWCVRGCVEMWVCVLCVCVGVCVCVCVCVCVFWV